MNRANADKFPPFLAGTMASMRLRRRAGEWDVLTSPSGVRTGDAALAAFAMAFPWAEVAAVARNGEGVEADLDLRLSWQTSDGTVGSSRLPAAGRFVFDPEARLSTFTVWPNLFSDEVYLYEPTGHGFDRKPAPFATAAALNREALHKALIAWESLTGGVLQEPDSELVDGIERTGFSPDARAR
ncbi:hypothetical protein WEI85_17125 [Actinomycetes bacterium KLBMP 9797]